MTTTLTQFEAEVLKETEKEFEMGGLSSGLYADYAIAVSRKISKQQREMMRKDLLEIAGQGEYEDLRREVENYFLLSNKEI